VSVVMTDEFFPVREWRYFVRGCTVHSPPPPPTLKRGGSAASLVWLLCGGETVESVWFFVYEFVKIVCLQEILELGGVD
jgi:hypothetical protein